MKKYTINTGDDLPPLLWGGGVACVKTDGNFGGGTLALTYCETDDGEFVPIGTSGFEFTYGCLMAATLPPGYIKFDLIGSTGASVGFGIAPASHVTQRTG